MMSEILIHASAQKCHSQMFQSVTSRQIIVQTMREMAAFCASLEASLTSLALPYTHGTCGPLVLSVSLCIIHKTAHFSLNVS